MLPFEIDLQNVLLLNISANSSFALKIFITAYAEQPCIAFW